MANALTSGLGDMFGNGLNVLGRYWWVIAIILGLVCLVAIIWFLQKTKRKKTQWTHFFKVRRVLQGGSISEQTTIRARRFPLEKGVEMFELEKPILGSYLSPQPGNLYLEVSF